VNYGTYTIPDLKRRISGMGAKMRMVW